MSAFAWDALRAAMALGRDSLALALEQTGAQAQMEFNADVPYYGRRQRYFMPRQTGAASILPRAQITDAERAAIAESLAAAAERLDDLNVAQSTLACRDRFAAANRFPSRRAPAHVSQLIAEQERRAKNAARQPAIKNVIEQDQVVRPRIPRSAP